MKEKLQQIRGNAMAQMKEAGSLDKLNEIKVAFLGKKGELTTIMKSMKDIPKEERPAFGQMVNEVRAEIENALDEMKQTLAKKARELQMKAEVIDVTLPAKKIGNYFPETYSKEQIEEVIFMLLDKWKENKEGVADAEDTV